MHNEFDLIAIGGGSGGLAVAEQAAQLGKRVAVVESAALGGTCVNVGCVPKKVMWTAAHIAEAVSDAKHFGISVGRSQLDWSALVNARQAYVNDITEYWDNYVVQQNITMIRGQASFLSSNEQGIHRLVVEGIEYHAAHIVIATGSQPIVPPVAGAELGMSSDGFFALKQQPKKVAVIGGGYIGVELSGVLKALGSDVTLMAMEDRLLATFDEMLSTQLATSMSTHGVDLKLSYTVNELQKRDNGIAVIAADGECCEGFDAVIWAVGRSPNVKSLNLVTVEVATQKNGMVIVDDAQNTNIDGIYALGDVTGKSPLTPVAVAAGRKLGLRLFGENPDSKLDYTMIPSVVFSHPPVATMGLTEQQACQQHEKVTVYQTLFTPMRYALNHQPIKTAMKLICIGEEQRVIGLHLIGDAVDEMLQGFSVAIKMGATKADFDQVVAIHPTAAEELVTLKQPARVYQRGEVLKAA